MQAKHPFIAVDNDNHSQSVQAEDSASSVICLFVVIYLLIILFVQVNADIDFFSAYQCCGQ
jgi:hypothetical protein